MCERQSDANVKQKTRAANVGKGATFRVTLYKEGAGGVKKRLQVTCCLVLALFVLYFLPEEKDMKTFERNAQRFETVCFPTFNTFPIAKKSFPLLRTMSTSLRI